MVTFEAGAPKRTIVIGLRRGDDILLSIEQAIEEYGITHGAIVSGIAALSQASFHRVLDYELKLNMEDVVVKAPMELSTLQGTIADGKPHVHMTFADEKGHTYAGHCNPGCIVLYVGEIVILDLGDAGFTRTPDEYGLMLLAKK